MQFLQPTCNKRICATCRRSLASRPGGPSPTQAPVGHMRSARCRGSRLALQCALLCEPQRLSRCDAERMVNSIARPPPVRADDRADELAGSEGQQSGSSERGKVMGDVAGLQSAPAASGSGLRAIVADRGGEQQHRQELRQIACNQGESTRAESAYGACGAGRCVGLGSANAVGSSQQMLQRIGHLRTPDST